MWEGGSNATSKSRQLPASGTISSFFSQVSPLAASVCAYAQCATQFEAVSSETNPRSFNAWPICFPCWRCDPPRRPKCSQAGRRSRFWLLHRSSRNAGQYTQTQFENCRIRITLQSGCHIPPEI